MDQKEQSPPKKEDSALIKQIKGSGLQYRTKNLVQNFETLMHLDFTYKTKTKKKN